MWKAIRIIMGVLEYILIFIVLYLVTSDRSWTLQLEYNKDMLYRLE